jgi:hypothetical protein
LQVTESFDAPFSSETCHLYKGTQNHAFTPFSRFPVLLALFLKGSLFVLHIHDNTVPYLLSTREISVPFITSYKVILRKESFGGIIASAYAGLVYVDEQAFDAISFLTRGKCEIGLADIERFGATSDEAQVLLGRLHKEKLISER